MIQATSSTTTTSTTTSTSSSTTTSNATMDKDSFLTLLCAQLQNQDPLDPMESYDFTAQLAQFTQIEQLTNISDLIQTAIDSNSTLMDTMSNTLAINLIGKEVAVNTSTINYDGTNAVEFSFDVPDDATALGVTVYDSSGNVVKNLDMTDFDFGTNTVSWDGTDSDGNAVDSGDYIITVAYNDSDGTTTSLQPYITGTITGIKYKDGETYVVVDGNEISFSNLKEIIGGSD
jgi:flagellar basal-body rod modification protein FlgD